MFLFYLNIYGYSAVTLQLQEINETLRTFLPQPSEMEYSAQPPNYFQALSDLNQKNDGAVVAALRHITSLNPSNDMVTFFQSTTTMFGRINRLARGERLSTIMADEAAQAAARAATQAIVAAVAHTRATTQAATAAAMVLLRQAGAASAAHGSALAEVIARDLAATRKRLGAVENECDAMRRECAAAQAAASAQRAKLVVAIRERDSARRERDAARRERDAVLARLDEPDQTAAPNDNDGSGPSEFTTVPLDSDPPSRESNGDGTTTPVATAYTPVTPTATAYTQATPTAMAYTPVTPTGLEGRTAVAKIAFIMSLTNAADMIVKAHKALNKYKIPVISTDVEVRGAISAVLFAPDLDTALSTAINARDRATKALVTLGQTLMTTALSINTKKAEKAGEAGALRKMASDVRGITSELLETIPDPVKIA